MSVFAFSDNLWILILIQLWCHQCRHQCTKTDNLMNHTMNMRQSHHLPSTWIYQFSPLVKLNQTGDWCWMFKWGSFRRSHQKPSADALCSLVWILGDVLVAPAMVWKWNTGAMCGCSDDDVLVTPWYGILVWLLRLPPSAITGSNVRSHEALEPMC